MKLMLVDDDVLLRDMYATKFAEAGDEVVTAGTGVEALQKLGDTTVDALVTDLVMPGMTGIELVQNVMGAEGPATKPACIILSNQSEESDLEHATQAGAIGYIVKAEHIPSEVVTKVHELI